MLTVSNAAVEGEMQFDRLTTPSIQFRPADIEDEEMF